MDMWREYIRMELGFVEGMRRRWSVLGIDSREDQGPQVGKGVEPDIDMGGDDDAIVNDEQGEKPPDEVIAAEKGGDEGEAARKAIMDGAIVKSALSSAAKALPTVELFVELEALIRNYPCQLRLRTTLVDHVYALLQEALPDDPRAIQMHATRQLRELILPKEDGKDIVEGDPHFVDSEKLIDALQSANERLTMAVKASWGTYTRSDTHTATRPNMSEIYADFVLEWCRSSTLEPRLKQYLMGSLQVLAQGPSALPVLQATHIRSIQLISASPGVWLARLDAEEAWACDPDDIKSAWASARAAVVASQDVDGAEKIWLWGLDHQSSNTEDRQAVYEPSGSASFTLERARDGLAEKPLLRAVYEYWRAVDGISAATAWAGWLMDHGDGKGATQVISNAMVQLGTEDKIRLTETWNSRLTGSQTKDKDGDGSEEEDLPLRLETS
ncbi:hypothetical protein J3R82DRAFT_10751 [Butyriboletus roseoflavus]|nr:hypothetical protein J3R82DRAFT_10751 [Butyriboletus roseoflavus]